MSCVQKWRTLIYKNQNKLFNRECANEYAYRYKRYVINSYYDDDDDYYYYTGESARCYCPKCNTIDAKLFLLLLQRFV